MANKLETVALNTINFLVPEITSGFNPIAEAYEKSEGHKFRKGDVLILRPARGNIVWAGYGGRPVAVVIAYEKHKDPFNRDRYGYRVHMYFDGKDPETGNPVRLKKEEIDFKWNIENKFKRAPKGITPERAVGLYKARK